jgi:hypothetical protein
MEIKNSPFPPNALTKPHLGAKNGSFLLSEHYQSWKDSRFLIFDQGLIGTNLRLFIS